MVFDAPYPPYDPTDKTGYETVVKRWPIIITGVIDQLHNTCYILAVSTENKDSFTTKIIEGKEIIGKISKLKYQMGRDHALEPIPVDGEPLADLYNMELEKLAENHKNTWFTAPWLYAECYLYRLLRSYFAQTEYWKAYDPFADQKLKTFQHSGNAILQIATSMHELATDTEAIQLDPSKLSLLVMEMIQMCLWGNATDLSLLTHLSPSDIENLQAVGKAARTARQNFILKDDQEKVWDHLQTLSKSRIDFVLDNSGFELYTDLVFADFLVTYTPYVSKVVFHSKLIPWFVSDVTPIDFRAAIDSLLDPAFFEVKAENTKAYEHLLAMVSRWKQYVTEGIFSLSVPVDTPLGGSLESSVGNFWTTPYPYWNMKSHAPALYEELQESSLVIFKGDLKLTGDIRWPASTSFATALGPLAGAFPLLSLRTNKADVVVGIEQKIADKLDDSGEKWRIDGRYALISFAQKEESAT
ncbi:DUF89 domain-containing protein [Cyathus striatus]|nr:DUF89 domain-containing protein [Cyathus striatus]